MAIHINTPGVYIDEVNAFGSSIISNDTGIPVFIGFTEFAKASNGDDLKLIKGSTIVREPVLVRSMLEYETTFGAGDDTGDIYVTEALVDNKAVYSSKNMKGTPLEPYTPGLMEPSVLNFFYNGGGSCYVISLGSYDDFIPEIAEVISGEMNFIMEAIRLAQTATLIVPTDLIRLGVNLYYKWGTQLIDFSANEKKHFTIMDTIVENPNDPQFNSSDIAKYRELVNPDYPSYAGAYYPYLKSLTAYAHKSDLSNVFLNGKPLLESDKARIEDVKSYLAINYINMPPSPFMAGIYCRIDSSTGVWTAPANVAPRGVTGPVVNLTNKQQEDLSIDAVAGKSINTIRSFTGKGTLVWGARTNNGNSQDWRYVNIRRLFNSMDTDISLALEAYVFKPNVRNTWVEVKTMIESYLFGLYGQGAFAGTTPETSYQVLIGLGETMTAEDILNGNMRVSIQVAAVRPAEFIVLTFEQMVAQ